MATDANIEEYTKDPSDVLDYKWDFTDWLSSGVTISSSSVSAESGLTVDSSTDTTTDVTAWLSGGTAGTSYLVKCTAVTTGGQTKTKRIRITVKNK